jgi:hypothetical protein
VNPAFNFWKTREIDEVLYGGPTSISMADVMRARNILDAQPVPDDGDRYVMTEHGWKQGVGFYTKRQGEDMVRLSTEANQHDASADPRPEPSGDHSPDRDL